jgi:Flp pilus assembly protein TadG
MRIKFGSQKGAALVEFAIVLPLLLILVFGIIDFSFLLYNKASITNASREGARTGIVFRANDAGVKIPVTSTIVQDIIKQRIWNYLGQADASSPAKNLVSFDSPKSVSIDIQPGTIGTPPESVLTIRVTYNYNFLVISRLLKLFFLSDMLENMDIVSESTMRIEG